MKKPIKQSLKIKVKRTIQKLIILISTTSILFSFCACGRDTKAEGNSSQGASEEGSGSDHSSESESQGQNQNQENNQENSQGGSQGNNQNQGENTLGQTLLEDFKTASGKQGVTNTDIAEAILRNEQIEFAGLTKDVEEGLLTGFTSEIKGFENGVMFAPMIGSIPFVGYIFTVSEGTDAIKFAETLKTNADMRWNVCTQADEMIVETNDNTVFFLMCPSNLE